MIDNRQLRAMYCGMTKSPEKLLIIWHGRTGASKALARTAYEGAGGGAVIMQASQVQPDDFFAAAGYLFVCPENLGSVSGAMKEMFDRNYYPVLGKIEGRAYATAIAAGSDGQGAQAQIDRIATGWRLKRVAEPFIVNLHAQSPQEILAPKIVEAGDLKLANDLGAALAEGCALGLF